METLPPLNIPDLLRRYGLRPRKGLGQNFLVDDNALRKIVEVSEIDQEDTVLEIGAGLGSLTRHLAAAAKQVVAVELDLGLLPPLEEVLAAFENIDIHQGDILELNLADLLTKGTSKDYIVVANIPYYITSALIRHLLEADRKPQRVVLTVQREVAMRICSEPGDMSLLALSVQVYGEPEIAARIPAGAFYPTPKVDSAVVRIGLYPSARIPEPQLKTFFRLAKAGFSQKRKTLRNALSGGMAWTKDHTEKLLESAGIDPQRRAETLSIDEWRKLTEYVIHKLDNQ
jgi:16S rRNA (adenine1518-N6/adenine1519-N6)-dimethyltransferase